VNKKQIIAEHYRSMGKKGGEARAEALSPEKRKKIARKGWLAMEKKRLAKLKNNA